MMINLLQAKYITHLQPNKKIKILRGTFKATNICQCRIPLHFKSLIITPNALKKTLGSLLRHSNYYTDAVQSTLNSQFTI